MNVYRIKHLPTGLYFIPSRFINAPDGSYAKSNLSKKGKTYLKKPSLKFLGDSYYNHTLPLLKERWNRERYLYPVVLSEWEIEVVV